MFHMKRREFITLLGGAAAAWPLAALAQQGTLRLVGVLAGFSEDEMWPLLAAFRSRMNQLGWLAIDVRLSTGDHQQTIAEAGMLVSRNPDVILAMGTPGLTAVRQHSYSVPVVFTLVGDPVRTGMIESLARPGGNTTGFTNFEFSIGGKWLQLLKEASPRLTHVTVIANPANPTANPLARVIEDAARAVSITVATAFVHDANDIQVAISGDRQQSGGGLIVLPDSLAVVHSGLIIDLAERNRLPALYPFRTFAAKGGLLTYGLDIPQIYRQAADYVDRILKGEKPADLPVQAPTKFELVINLKTAKTLGLTIPDQLLAAADEVIE
jgi:putative ABC transport system substrate-binding protein